MKRRILFALFAFCLGGCGTASDDADSAGADVVLGSPKKPTENTQKTAANTQINLQNWQTHKEIVAIRDLSTEIEDGLKKGTLVSKEGAKADCGGWSAVVDKQTQRIRRLDAKFPGTNDTNSLVYDHDGRSLRFVFSQSGSGGADPFVRSRVYYLTKTGDDCPALPKTDERYQSCMWEVKQSAAKLEDFAKAKYELVPPDKSTLSELLGGTNPRTQDPESILQTPPDCE